MDYEEQIRKHLKEHGGIITAAFCRENNIPTIYLSRLTAAGVLSRVEKGIYLTKDGDFDEYYFFQYRYSKTIYSYETAMYLLGITDKIVKKMDVTVSSDYKINAAKLNINAHYVKKSMLNVGVINVKTMFGNVVRAYSYERLICDFIAHRKAMDSETYGKLLRSYVKYKNRDINELYKIAREMEMEGKVHDVLEVIYEQG